MALVKMVQWTVPMIASQCPSGNNKNIGSTECKSGKSLHNTKTPFEWDSSLLGMVYGAMVGCCGQISCALTNHLCTVFRRIININYVWLQSKLTDKWVITTEMKNKTKRNEYNSCIEKAIPKAIATGQ